MKHCFQIVCLILICTLQECQCKKDDSTSPNVQTSQDQLPPITTEAKGTFGCKINGKVWLPKTNTTPPWPPVYASVDRNHGWNIGVSGTYKTGNEYILVVLSFYFNKDSVNYSLQNYPPGGQYIDVANNKLWSSDSLRVGQVSLLKFDTTNQIISGIFNFNCINTQTGEILNITDGRFDTHFIY
jgi:hypothetical protein